MRGLAAAWSCAVPALRKPVRSPAWPSPSATASLPPVPLTTPTGPLLQPSGPFPPSDFELKARSRAKKANSARPVALRFAGHCLLAGAIGDDGASQCIEIDDSQPGVPMEHGGPFGENARTAQRRADQATGDCCSGVGIVARANAELEYLRQILTSFGDRPPGGLQRVDDPTVVRKVCRRTRFGDVEHRQPILTRRVGSAVQVSPHTVDCAGQNRAADRETPRSGRLPGHARRSG